MNRNPQPPALSFPAGFRFGQTAVRIRLTDGNEVRGVIASLINGGPDQQTDLLRINGNTVPMMNVREILAA